MTRPLLNTRDIIPHAGSNTEQWFLRRKLPHPNSHTFFAPWHLSSLFFLVPLPWNCGFLSCSPFLFLQSLLSISGIFTSQWEAKRCKGGSAGWGRKYAKALAESQNRGGDWNREKKEGIVGRSRGRALCSCGLPMMRAGLGPAESPLHYNFEIPVLTCSKPFLQ